MLQVGGEIGCSTQHCILMPLKSIHCVCSITYFMYKKYHCEETNQVVDQKQIHTKYMTGPGDFPS